MNTLTEQNKKLKDIIVNYKLMNITKDEGVRNACKIKIQERESELLALEQQEPLTDEAIRDYSFKNYGRLSHLSTIGIIETAIKEFIHSRLSVQEPRDEAICPECNNPRNDHKAHCNYEWRAD